jgi:uncharacterized protein
LTTSPADYARSIEAAREARIARLRSRGGWLSLVGKAFLAPGKLILGSAKDCSARLPPGAPSVVGSLEVTGNAVRLVVADGVNAVLEASGERITSRLLRSDKDGPADAILVGGFVVELMERGETLALRVRDLREIPRPFAGISTFPLDPTWRVGCRFLAHDAPRPVDIDFEGIAGVNDSFLSPGIVSFERDGTEHRIQAVYEDASQRRLFLLFRDATSGPESYGLGRFVYADLPDTSGAVTLDFNLALLPGCAFTPFATCPIPPRENRIAIPVRAGEREYLGELPPIE